MYYSLSSSAFVNAKVYNNDSGEFIETLVNENKTAGSHSVLWDGKDAGGQSYEDGTYLMIITTGDQSSTEEIALRSY